jgi:hypothetical protein
VWRLSLCALPPPPRRACVLQVVSDRGCIKEYLRLQSSALTLAQDPAELAKAKPFAVEVRTHTQGRGSMCRLGGNGALVFTLGGCQNQVSWGGGVFGIVGLVHDAWT